MSEKLNIGIDSSKLESIANIIKTYVKDPESLKAIGNALDEIIDEEK